MASTTAGCSETAVGEENEHVFGQAKRPLKRPSLSDNSDDEKLSKLSRVDDASIELVQLDKLPDDVLLHILNLLLTPDSPMKMLRTIGSATRRFRRLCFLPMFWGADSLVMLLEPMRIREIIRHIPNYSSQITSAALSVRAHSHAMSRGMNPLEALNTCIRALAEVCQLATGITKVSYFSVGSLLPTFNDLLPKLPLQALHITEFMSSDGDMKQLLTQYWKRHHHFQAYDNRYVIQTLGFEVGTNSSRRNVKMEDMTLLLKECSGLTELSANVIFPPDPEKMLQLATNMLLWFPHLSILELAHNKFQYSSHTMKPSLDLSFLSCAGTSIVVLKLANMRLGCLSALSLLRSLKSLILIDCSYSSGDASAADGLWLVNSGVSSISVKNSNDYWDLNVVFDTCANLSEVVIHFLSNGNPSVTIDNCANLKSISVLHNFRSNMRTTTPPLPTLVRGCPSVTSLVAPTIRPHLLDSLPLLSSFELANTAECSVMSVVKEAPCALRLIRLSLQQCEFGDDGSDIFTLALPLVKDMDLVCRSFPSVLCLMCPRLESLVLDVVSNSMYPPLHIMRMALTTVDITGCPRLKSLEASLHSVWDMDVISNATCATGLSVLKLFYCKLTCHMGAGLRLSVLQRLEMKGYDYPPVLPLHCPELQILVLHSLPRSDATGKRTSVSICGCTKLERIELDNESKDETCFRMTLERAISVAVANPALKGKKSNFNLESLLRVIPGPDHAHAMFKQIFQEGLTARWAISLLALDKSSGVDPKYLLTLLNDTERGEAKSFCEKWLSFL